MFVSHGYTQVNGKYFGDYGSNGFDGVFIKGTIENPTEMIIVECKQMKSDGSVVLNSKAATGLPPQMSDSWMKYVAKENLLKVGGDKSKLAEVILSSHTGFIKKIVVAVDKAEKEVNFLKLENY